MTADGVALNADIYARTKDRSLADIKQDSARSWSALRSAVEVSSEDELLRPNPHVPDGQVWQVVPSEAGHVGGHLMSWFMDTGDPGRAESAAEWGYEIECSLLPEGARRADAAYNLACFYARAGRIDDALPLLRASLSVNAELAKWAHEDSDLDGIRDDPRVKALLGA